MSNSAGMTESNQVDCLNVPGQPPWIFRDYWPQAGLPSALGRKSAVQSAADQAQKIFQELDGALPSRDWESPFSAGTAPASRASQEGQDTLHSSAAGLSIQLVDEPPMTKILQDAWQTDAQMIPDVTPSAWVLLQEAQTLLHSLASTVHCEPGEFPAAPERTVAEEFSRQLSRKTVRVVLERLLAEEAASLSPVPLCDRSAILQQQPQLEPQTEEFLQHRLPGLSVLDDTFRSLHPQLSNLFHELENIPVPFGSAVSDQHYAKTDLDSMIPNTLCGFQQGLLQSEGSQSVVQSVSSWDPPGPSTVPGLQDAQQESRFLITSLAHVPENEVLVPTDWPERTELPDSSDRRAAALLAVEQARRTLQALARNMDFTDTLKAAPPEEEVPPLSEREFVAKLANPGGEPMLSSLIASLFGVQDEAALVCNQTELKAPEGIPGPEEISLTQELLASAPQMSPHRDAALSTQVSEGEFAGWVVDKRMLAKRKESPERGCRSPRLQVASSFQAKCSTSTDGCSADADKLQLLSDREEALAQREARCAQQLAECERRCADREQILKAREEKLVALEDMERTDCSGYCTGPSGLNVVASDAQRAPKPRLLSGTKTIRSGEGINQGSCTRRSARGMSRDLCYRLSTLEARLRSVAASTRRAKEIEALHA